MQEVAITDAVIFKPGSAVFDESSFHTHVDITTQDCITKETHGEIIHHSEVHKDAGQLAKPVPFLPLPAAG